MPGDVGGSADARILNNEVYKRNVLSGFINYMSEKVGIRLRKNGCPLQKQQHKNEYFEFH
jgi:hypothetical protein